MPAERSSSPSARQRLFLLARITVSVGLLALLLSKIDLGRFWDGARTASPAWLAAALAVYCINVLAGVWRWHLLLDAQLVAIPLRTLLGSMLAALFFNNFLPTSIGGDVFRIRDTARPAQSVTVATMVVLTDRIAGMLGLALVCAIGATMARSSGRALPMAPEWLWAAALAGLAIAVTPILLHSGTVSRLLQPLTRLHPEWIGGRIATITTVLERYRERPSALAGCYAGAVLVQALIVVFFAAVTRALGVGISPWDLAIIVPISLLASMIPVSLNGFGVREATFSVYFTRLGLPLESALLAAFVGTGLTMLFSLSGGVVYAMRRDSIRDVMGTADASGG